MEFMKQVFPRLEMPTLPPDLHNSESNGKKWGTHEYAYIYAEIREIGDV